MDIDQNLIEFTEKPDETIISSARRFCENHSSYLKAAAKLDLLEKGQRVEHAILGTGTVIDINTDDETWIPETHNYGSGITARPPVKQAMA